MGPKGALIQVWGLVDLALLYRVFAKMRIAVNVAGPFVKGLKISGWVKLFTIILG
jgi:hypothetical protein